MNKEILLLNIDKVHTTKLRDNINLSYEEIKNIRIDIES